MRLALLSAALLLLASVSSARAHEVHALEYDLRVDVPVLAVGATFWTTTELLKSTLAPTRCRWCDDNALDRAARNAFAWQRTDVAGRLSDVMAFAIMPGVAFGGITALAAHDDALSGAGIDALIIAESLVISATVTQIGKLAAGRERPFVHALDAQGKAGTRRPEDNNLSFFSGHTSMAFSLAVAAGTVASMRDYRGAPILWAVGLPLAAFTGYLRIAADRHYLSDVLVGAAVGSAVGVLVPRFMHRRKSESELPALSMSPRPLALTLTFTR